MSNFNFLPKKDVTRRLQAAIAACLGVTTIMVWAMVWDGQGSRKAYIGDTLATESDVPNASVSAAAPKSLGSGSVASFIPVGGENIQYYEAGTGRIFRVNLNTSKTEIISDKRMPGFVKAYPSADGQSSVIAVQDKNGLSLKYSLTGSQVNTSLGKIAFAAAFSPDGQELAYLDSDERAAGLFVADKDGSEGRKIINLHNPQGVLEWPQKNRISLLTYRTNSPERDLSLIDRNGSLQLLLSGRENLEYTWSRSGTKILFSYYSAEKGVQLWYMDIDGGVPVSLGVQTSAAKCAWQSDELSVVCGVPTSSLSRDTPVEKTATLDGIVRVNMADGSVNRLYSAKSDALISIGESVISAAGSHFVFKNLFDQRLYSLPLN